MQEIKGEEVLPEVHASLNLGLDIRIPLDYIADEQHGFGHTNASPRRKRKRMRNVPPTSFRTGMDHLPTPCSICSASLF